MKDIAFYEAFTEEEKAIRHFLPGKVKAFFTSQTIQECGHKKPPASFISTRTQSIIPAAWAPKIKAVLTRSKGFDHLTRFRSQTNGRITYGYLGTYSSESVAEQAIMAMLVLMRKLKAQIRHFKDFDREKLTGTECFGKNALVVGVGHIGEHIAELCRGLQMNIKGVDIVKKDKFLEYVPLKEGLLWADVIFCALSLNEETNNIFNYKTLKGAKKGAIFVNIARGEMSPLEGLKKLLSKNILGGVALDVFPEENDLAHYLRNKKGNKSLAKLALELSKQDNVLFTPHNAFNTEEALKRKAALSVEAVVSYLNKGAFPHPVPK